MHSGNSNSMYLFIHPVQTVMVEQGEPVRITEHDVSSETIGRCHCPGSDR